MALSEDCIPYRYYLLDNGLIARRRGPYKHLAEMEYLKLDGSWNPARFIAPKREWTEVADEHGTPLRKSRWFDYPTSRGAGMPWELAGDGRFLLHCATGPHGAKEFEPEQDVREYSDDPRKPEAVELDTSYEDIMAAIRGATPEPKPAPFEPPKPRYRYFLDDGDNPEWAWRTDGKAVEYRSLRWVAPRWRLARRVRPAGFGLLGKREIDHDPFDKPSPKLASEAERAMAAAYRQMQYGTGMPTATDAERASIAGELMREMQFGPCLNTNQQGSKLMPTDWNTFLGMKANVEVASRRESEKSARCGRRWDGIACCVARVCDVTPRVRSCVPAGVPRSKSFTRSGRLIELGAATPP